MKHEGLRDGANVTLEINIERFTANSPGSSLSAGLAF